MALPRRLSAGRIPGLTASPVFAPASDILNYYFLCNQAVSNPFQQVRAAGEGAGGGGCGWGLELGTPGWEERRRGVGGGGQPLGPPPSLCLLAEADSVPASSGQHPLPAAGPGAGSCAPVPFCAGRRAGCSPYTPTPRRGRGRGLERWAES